MGNDRRIEITEFTLIIVSIPLVIVGIVLWTTFGADDSQSQVTEQEIRSQVQNPQNVDSDGDGLFDWEERLYRLDPHNPDSDGDGIPDGEEAKEKERLFLTRGESSSDSSIEASFAELEEEVVFSETIGRSEQEEGVNVLIREITPATVSPGDTVTIRGEGFTETGNAIYAGYRAFYNQKSSDGETLSFVFEPDFSSPPAGATSAPEFPVWIYVQNTNGLSNAGTFYMRMR